MLKRCNSDHSPDYNPILHKFSNYLAELDSKNATRFEQSDISIIRRLYNITYRHTSTIMMINISPKKQSAKEMAEKTVALRTRTQELLLFAKKIQDDRENFSTEKTEMGCCSKMGKTRKIEKMTKKLKVEYHKLEQHLEIYDLENTLTANPLVACLKLVLGTHIFLFMDR